MFSFKKIFVVLISVCSLATSTTFQNDKLPSIVGGSKSVQEAFKYPKIMMEQNAITTGKSIAEFFINKDGKVTDITVIKSLGPVFDQVMIEGVKRLEFVPASINGKPISVKYKLPIIFRKN
ncbi:MAG: energy transducer TonB [bacterium]|jgi:protein TonB